jgi:hypothetical protein
VAKSRSRELRDRFERWGAEPSAELALALATKLRLLRIVGARVNEDLRKLREQLQAHPDKVDWAVRNQGAFTLERDDLAYQLVADLDAFLFETRSTYEIVGRLLKAFSEMVLKRPINETTLRSVIEAAGHRTEWIELLRSDRIHFFHYSAPWLGVEKLSAPPGHGLLVLRRNTHDFANPDDYVRFDDYRNAWTGFVASFEVLRGWLVQQIEELEAQLP